MAEDKTLMEKGLEQFFHDVELIKKFLNMPPFSTTRDAIAYILESTYVKWEDDVMKAAQPDVKLEQKMGRAYNDCKSDIAALQLKGIITPEMRDAYMKSYDGLKEYSSLEEGIAGGTALDTLHQVNQPILERINELEAGAWAPGSKGEKILVDPEMHKQAIDLSARMCLFNQQFAKECEFATSLRELKQGLDRCEKTLDERMPEITKSIIPTYQEKLKEYNKNIISLGARAHAALARTESRLSHRQVDAIRSGNQKSKSAIPTNPLPIHRKGTAR